MNRGLLWLALADLGRAWLRSGLVALAIAAAILAVAFFAGQIKLRQSEVMAAYEAAGAATFVVQLTGVADNEIDSLTGGIRTLSDVSSAEAPYSGITSNIAADTSFLVFRNEQQQEYLGARTSVLGVDRSFDLARDYYVDLHEINPQAPQMLLGIPLLITTGESRPPGRQEVLVPSGVADYVGVQPGAEAIVEFVYSGRGEPIIQRFDGLRLIGTFDMAGPDQGRFEPFWRFNAKGQDVLTVRAEAARIGITSLPIVVNLKLFRDFLSFVAKELTHQGSGAALLPARDHFVVRASSIGNVPGAIFGIEPEKESQVSAFSVGRGRPLRADDGAVVVLDQASAKALGVNLGDSFPVRKADGKDLSLTVVGILDRLELRDPPPRTIAAPVLTPDSSYVSSGVFVTLRTSKEIFARSTLTDALVIAPAPQDVPSVVDRLREAFRLEPAVFITERYGQFRRKIHDFAQTLALFAIISVTTAALAGSFAANLLHDVYADRRRQYAILLALGFSPMQTTIVGIAIGIAAAGAGTIIGALVAVTCSPSRFAMPSLMADLGAIEPSFDLPVAAVVTGVALVAVTFWHGPHCMVAA